MGDPKGLRAAYHAALFGAKGQPDWAKEHAIKEATVMGAWPSLRLAVHVRAWQACALLPPTPATPNCPTPWCCARQPIDRTRPTPSWQRPPLPSRGLCAHLSFSHLGGREKQGACELRGSVCLSRNPSPLYSLSSTGVESIPYPPSPSPGLGASGLVDFHPHRRFSRVHTQHNPAHPTPAAQPLTHPTRGHHQPPTTVYLRRLSYM